MTSSSCECRSGSTRVTARRIPDSPSVSCSSRLGGGLTADAQQRRLQLLEGVRARGHVGDEPVRRSGESAAAQGGQQPGVDHARLAAPARADQGDEPAPGPGLAEPGEQPLDEPLPPEEVGGVGLLEGPQALVGVAGPASARPAAPPSPAAAWTAATNESRVVVPRRQEIGTLDDAEPVRRARRLGGRRRSCAGRALAPVRA